MALVLGMALAVSAAGCGDDDGSSGGATAPSEGEGTTVASEPGSVASEVSSSSMGSGTTDANAATDATRPTTASSSQPATNDGEWDAVVAAAGEEGSVTIYSAQPLDPLNAMVDRFEQAYPDINVDIARLTDGDLGAKIEVEKQSGQYLADMWVTSSQTLIEPKAAEGGWMVPPTGPGFNAEGYLPEYLHDGGPFEVGAALLTFGWNTAQYPSGLEDYTGLLDPELAGGRIAVIDANCCPAAVDFYLYLEETYGVDFVEQLAAQEPLIYPSALPIGEALGSGEVAAAAFTLPLTTQMAAGAPVDFGLAETTWGTRFLGALVDGAPHPNAAQVLANFMVSADAQEVLAKDQSAVLPDIPGALTTNDRVRVQDPTALTPEKVAEYQAHWNKMFK